MKKFLVIGVFLWISTFGLAQNGSNSSIQIPSTPGMSIIGIQNAEVNKPGNYTGLYTSLVSPIVSNNGTVPTDLSLDFSPFYLQSRDITLDELDRTNLFRDLKISIASTQVVGSDSTLLARMGIGLKTILINGNGKLSMSKEEKQALDTAYKLSAIGIVNHVKTNFNFKNYGDLDTTSLSMFTKHITEDPYKIGPRIEKIVRDHRPDQGKIIEELDKLAKEFANKIEPDLSPYDNSLRTGHFLELAGAIAVDFPQNNFNYSRVDRWGIWLNYTYRPSKGIKNFDFAGILRISNYSFDPTVIFDKGAIFTDFGLSLNFRVPNTKLTVAAELVGKFGFLDVTSTQGGNERTLRSVNESKWNVTFGYRITDNTIFSMSLAELAGNNDYLKEQAMQFLMGISASLVPLKK